MIASQGTTRQVKWKRFIPWSHWLVRVDKPWMRRVLFFGSGIGLGLVLIPIVLYSWFLFHYSGKIFPGVMVSGYSLTGLTPVEATKLLSQETNRFVEGWPVQWQYGEMDWEIEDSIIFWKLDETVSKAFSMGREFSWLENLRQQWQLYFQPVNIPVYFSLQPDKLNPVLAQIEESINQDEIVPELERVQTATGSAIVLHQGQAGQRVDRDELVGELTESISWLRMPQVMIPVKPIVTKLSSEQLAMGVERAKRLLGKRLYLLVEGEADMAWYLDEAELVPFVDFVDGYDREKLELYLQQVAEKVNRDPVNARFGFDAATGRVSEFAAAKDGLALDVVASAQLMRVGLEGLEITSDQVLGMASDGSNPGEVKLIVMRVEPEITLDDANDLGIKELLGRGVSTYKGSIPSRVHNVELAASRLAGVLVKPGEEFSFNASVGEVSGATGYQAAYVISNGRTELGDGGGVCQDSTTVFRAALDAGLPITSRRGHSYRVGYYEQNTKAGLDATVYAPTTDFKFLNDTPAHLLIQTMVDSPNRTLVVEIYGTSDGRDAEILNHQVYDVTPALPDQYIDDPTLGPGVVKQIDWAAGGAKAKFDYVVKRDGSVIHEKTFYTVYRPWAAKFLRGI